MNKGEKYTKDGYVFEVASFFWYEAAEMVNLYNLDDGEMISLHVDDTEEYTKYADPEPKMIENTEKVKWAMNEMSGIQFYDKVTRYMGYLEDIRNLLKSENHLDEAKTLDVIYEFISVLKAPAIQKSIDRLSRPEKFDAVEHMRDEGIVYSKMAGIELWMENGEIRSRPGKSNDVEDVDQFYLDKPFYALAHIGDLKPYVDPEPTPLELIETARSCIHEALGTSVGTEVDAIRSALDACEKALTE